MDQVRSRLISQLIKGISKVLQKLFRCFNGTIVLTFFIPLLPAIFSVTLSASVIELTTLKSVIASLESKAGLSLQLCHKIPDVSE